MIEYEYTFKVKQIDAVIEFCEKNGFKLVSKSWQNRKVFENKHNRKIISRLTSTCADGSVAEWDFKNVDNKNAQFKVSQESNVMILDKNGIENALSMLETMDFEMSADNERTRYVYEKDDVKFEIDDYTRPQMKVVAVEGDKTQVDQVYAALLKDEKVSASMI